MFPETVQENPVPVAPATPAPQVPESPQPSSGSFPIIPVVVVILVLVGAAVFFLMNRSASNLSKAPAQNNGGATITQQAKAPTVTPVSEEQAIDDNLTALDRDLSALDSGLNDKQGDLSE